MECRRLADIYVAVVKAVPKVKREEGLLAARSAGTLEKRKCPNPFN